MVYDMEITIIVNGVYEPFYNWGAPHSTNIIS